MVRVALLACLIPAVASAQSAERTREGITIEANVGLGWIRSSPTHAPSYTSGVSFGLDLGLGAWLTPQLALTGRFAGLTSLEDGERFGAYILGPSVQYWFEPRWFLGAGAGLGLLGSSTSDNELGFAFDLRMGYAFSTTDERTLTGSVEITPARFTAAGDSATLTAVALLFGFQYL